MPGARRLAVVQAVRGERAQLQEGAAGVEQPVDPLADGQLAALAVAGDGLLVAAGAARRRPPSWRRAGRRRAPAIASWLARVSGARRVKTAPEDGHGPDDTRRPGERSRATTRPTATAIHGPTSVPLPQSWSMEQLAGHPCEECKPCRAPAHERRSGAHGRGGARHPTARANGPRKKTNHDNMSKPPSPPAMSPTRTARRVTVFGRPARRASRALVGVHDGVGRGSPDRGHEREERQAEEQRPEGGGPQPARCRHSRLTVAAVRAASVPPSTSATAGRTTKPSPRTSLRDRRQRAEADAGPERRARRPRRR